MRPGDRVAIWAPNGYRWIVAALGLWEAGAVLVPVNTRFKGAEAAVILGRYVPGSPLEPYFTLSREGIIIAIALYGFIASVLPVWMLLAPRDYLSTFMKIGTIALLAVGIIVTLPVMENEAVTKFASSGEGPVFAGSLFPFVFITIACGALSGFHSLIASGTTPKMIESEPQVRFIGYGAMLMESFVAVMAIIAASIIDPGHYYAMNAPAAVVGDSVQSASTAVNELGFTISPDALSQAAQDDVFAAPDPDDLPIAAPADARCVEPVAGVVHVVLELLAVASLAEDPKLPARVALDDLEHAGDGLVPALVEGADPRRRMRKRFARFLGETPERGFTAVQNLYARTLDWSLAHRWVIVLMCVVSLLAIPFLAGAASKNFLPDEDESQFQANIRTPEGTSIDSPAVKRDLAAMDARLERALPGSRVASYASTGDETFVSGEGIRSASVGTTLAAGGLRVEPFGMALDTAKFQPQHPKFEQIQQIDSELSHAITSPVVCEKALLMASAIAPFGAPPPSGLMEFQ